MQVQLPPVLFYAVGVMLVVFGALRACQLGWKRQNAGLTKESPARERERKRHLVFGIVWVAMGLFLIISTAINVRK